MKNPAERQAETAREFAERLRALREFKEFTQTKLAQMSGLTPAAVSQLEGAQREPNFSTIVKLATALGVTPNELMGIEGEEADPKVQGLFRELKGLSGADIQKVKSYAQFLRQRGEAG